MTARKPAHPFNGLATTDPSPVGRLTRAAIRAAGAATVSAAVSAAWGEIHRPHVDGGSQMSAAFRFWCEAENFSYSPTGLAEVIRRRYKGGTAADVAGSLRRGMEIAGLAEIMEADEARRQRLAELDRTHRFGHRLPRP